MARTTPPRNTPAFFLQAAVAFAVSSGGLLVGVGYLPLDRWQRAFLAMTALFVITSSFMLAKVIRDQQEGSSVVSRIDEARMEKLMAEYDPFRATPLEAAPPR